MTQRTDPTANARRADSYEIQLGVRLDPSWARQFDGFSLGHNEDGTTVLTGRLVDQAALHGVLQRVRDLGLPLVAVTPLGATAPSTQKPSHSILDGDSK